MMEQVTGEVQTYVQINEEPPPFTPEQVQWIDRLVALRQEASGGVDPTGAPSTSTATTPPGPLLPPLSAAATGEPGWAARHARVGGGVAWNVCDGL